MLRLLLFILVPTLSLAQAGDGDCPTPLTAGGANLFDHLAWSAKGTVANQAYGAVGLDTAGYLNAAFPHAICIGQNLGGHHSLLVGNRFIGDTGVIYEFPGERVWRCNLNGDKWADFVCWDKIKGTFLALAGTHLMDKFDTLLALQNNHYKSIVDNSIAVVNCDGDEYDDLLIDDGLYQAVPNGEYLGRLLFYRGGKSMSSIPSAELVGDSEAKMLGIYVNSGRLSKSNHGCFLLGKYMQDSVVFARFRLGSEFTLFPTDTIVCYTRTGGSQTSYNLIDIDGDSIDDIVVGGSQRVLVFRGGDSIPHEPSFSFRRPFETSSASFGSRIVDVGDV